MFKWSKAERQDRRQLDNLIRSQGDAAGAARRYREARDLYLYARTYNDEARLAGLAEDSERSSDYAVYQLYLYINGYRWGDAYR